MVLLACKPSNNDEAGQRGHQALRRINLGAWEHWAVGVGIWYPGPGEGVGSAPAAPAAATTMAATAAAERTMLRLVFICSASYSLVWWMRGEARQVGTSESHT